MLPKRNMDVAKKQHGMLPKSNTDVAKKQHIADGGGRKWGNDDRGSCHSSFVIITAKTRF